MGLMSGRPVHQLGLQGGRFAPCPDTPNCVSSQAAPPDGTHYIAPIAYADAPAAAWQRLRGAVRALPRATIVTDRADYLHAEVASALLGFIDDLECTLDAAARLIHVRSAARLGRTDFGVNRKRVELLRTRLSR